uniref:Uncharacterized protein n=1 Tax=Arundo donax TaxID=35708 RepID=A0A0A9FKE4_ARUDO
MSGYEFKFYQCICGYMKMFMVELECRILPSFFYV